MTEQTNVTPDAEDEQATADVTEEQATDEQAIDADVTDAEEGSEDEATDEDANEDEASEPGPVEEQEWYDDVFDILFTRALKLATAVNDEVAYLNANSSDLLTVVESVEQDNSDDKVKAANDRIEELKSEVLKLESLRRDYAMGKAKALIAERKDDDTIKAHTETHAKARTAWRDYVKVFKSNYPGADLTPYLPEVKNLSRSGGKGKGEGGQRLRGFVLWTVDGTKVGTTSKGVFNSTASDAAKAAGIDLSELQNEYKRINGDDSKSWPRVSNFEFKGHTFSAQREDKDAAKTSADVSPANVESTNGQATS